MTSGLFDEFPKLGRSVRVTSPRSVQYNCIAWALGKIDRWWWPHSDTYWPSICPEEETIPAFEAVFRVFGYEPCEDGRIERGYEKIALYAKGNWPKHAARQLRNGRWTSKCGKNVDIEHRPEELEGEKYGQVVKYFRRQVLPTSRPTVDNVH